VSAGSLATILTATAALAGVLFAYLQGVRSTRQEKSAQVAANALAERQQEFEERKEYTARLERELARAEHREEVARSEHRAEVAQLRADLALLRDTLIAVGEHINGDLRRRANRDIAATDPDR
jgi:uncharacterized protein YpuA (DUF1002 family)